MRAWRLATSLHPPLTGQGAALRGGRWNSVGTGMVYASSHLSLALVELLVHLEALELPGNLVAYEIAFPDELLEKVRREALPGGWRGDLRLTREIGSDWIASSRSAALSVPSAVVPSEADILLNPAHGRFSEVEVTRQEPFRLDERLAPH